MSRSAEINPNSLALPFAGHMNEAVSHRQFTTLAGRLATEGFDRQLQVGPGEGRWTAYMGVLDGITAAHARFEDESLAAPNTIPTTRVDVGFTDPLARARFHTVTETLLAGVAGRQMPRLRTGEPDTLRMTSFGNPDLCSLGRTGTALFYQEYKGLGRLLRPVLQHTVREIQDSGVVPRLPTELQDRIEWHADAIGVDSLLTSGRLSFIGDSMRVALDREGVKRIMQRPRDNRPALERDLHFYAKNTDSGIPVSATTVGRQVVDEMRDRGEQLMQPIRRRDAAGAVGGIVNIIGGQGITEGGSTLAGALITVGRAIGPAIRGRLEDRRQLA